MQTSAIGIIVEMIVFLAVMYQISDEVTKKASCGLLLLHFFFKINNPTILEFVTNEKYDKLI